MKIKSIYSISFILSVLILTITIVCLGVRLGKSDFHCHQIATGEVQVAYLDTPNAAYFPASAHELFARAQYAAEPISVLPTTENVVVSVLKAPIDESPAEPVISPVADIITSGTSEYSNNSSFPPPVILESSVHEHNYSTFCVEATCTYRGYTTYTCDCGDEYEDDYTDVLPHKYSASVISPTCTDYGYTLYLCDCGASYRDEYIDYTPHSWSAWQVTIEATINDFGEKARNCLECGCVSTAPIDKKTAVKLMTIEPTNLFENASPNTKMIVEIILETIRANSGKALKDNQPLTLVRENVLFDPNNRNEICSYLSFYFGTYDGVKSLWEYMPHSNGLCDIYVDVKKACDLEKGRVKMMNNVNNILSTFEAGSQDELIYQVCVYLSGSLSYDLCQPNADVALTSSTGNCNVYSTLMRLMLHRLGIQSDICIGYTLEGGYHAWNRVLFPDGQYKYYDVTFYDWFGMNSYIGSAEPFHNQLTSNCFLSSR